jgi:hypothetical protein
MLNDNRSRFLLSDAFSVMSNATKSAGGQSGMSEAEK